MQRPKYLTHFKIAYMAMGGNIMIFVYYTKRVKIQPIRRQRCNGNLI